MTLEFYITAIFVFSNNFIDMNIKITYNWLREYLDTDATAFELQKYLSLCGPSVERVTPVEDDFIFDIEITTNRIDMASVLGIAQEAVVILPQFKKKAKLITQPLTKTFSDIKSDQNTKQKTIAIDAIDPELTARFTGIIMASCKQNKTPEIIAKRLTWCDIRPINIIVDISNYIMLALGQPNHTFDYDSIGGAKIKLRLSKQGETMITLDGKTITLSDEDMVIEDGKGKIIDLAGIMGGKNSEITEKTSTIFILMETYDGKKIRQTAMTTGQRSIAATYFEKGLDPERIEPALVAITTMMQDLTGAKIGSEVFDQFPGKEAKKSISVNYKTIVDKMGVELEKVKVIAILESLGFSITDTNSEFSVKVPSYRNHDMFGPQDIIEEVARIYGYHNIPNIVQTTTMVKQPKDLDIRFTVEKMTRTFLKHQGYHEVMNYSMISKQLLEKADISISEPLKLVNTISEEIEYMRPSLIPSLLSNIANNQGKRAVLEFFEIAHIYIPQKNELPNEESHLVIASTREYSPVKGVIEGLLAELHIESVHFIPSTTNQFVSPNTQASLYIHDKAIGVIGMVKPQMTDRFTIKQPICIVDITLQTVQQFVRVSSRYVPPNPFALISQDISIIKKITDHYADMVTKIQAISPLVSSVEYLNSYEQKISIRIYFQDKEKNISEAEIKPIVEKIIATLSN